MIEIISRDKATRQVLAQFAAIMSILLILVGSLTAQEYSVLPPLGSWGVSLNLTSSNWFGIRKMVTPNVNVSLNIYLDLERTDTEEEKTYGIQPSVRFYRRTENKAVPYVYVAVYFIRAEGVYLSYQEPDVSRRSAGALAAIGVEWFPLERMSLAGATGVDVTHQSVTPTGGDTYTNFFLQSYKSSLSLNLYF